MRISDLNTVEGVSCLQPQYEDAALSAGYTSDLLSDVMAHAREGAVLITIQAHKNTVAVASLSGILAIVFCNNRPVGVFRTNENQFLASARIAQHLGGCPAR